MKTKTQPKERSPDDLADNSFYPVNHTTGAIHMKAFRLKRDAELSYPGCEGIRGRDIKSDWETTYQRQDYNLVDQLLYPEFAKTRFYPVDHQAKLVFWSTGPSKEAIEAAYPGCEGIGGSVLSKNWGKYEKSGYIVKLVRREARGGGNRGAGRHFQGAERKRINIDGEVHLQLKMRWQRLRMSETDFKLPFKEWCSKLVMDCLIKELKEVAPLVEPFSDKPVQIGLTVEAYDRLGNLCERLEGRTSHPPDYGTVFSAIARHYLTSAQLDRWVGED